MGDRKSKKKPAVNQMKKLKWETAKDLGLNDDLKNAGDDLTVREAGKIGGQMTKKLVKQGENSLTKKQSPKK